jgi:hypothetical protein
MATLKELFSRDVNNLTFSLSRVIIILYHFLICLAALVVLSNRYMPF